MAYKIPAASVVSQQFPDFIKEDYPAFVNFVKLYYQYLDETEKSSIGDSLETIRDVDNTLDSFIDALWKEFGTNVPRLDPEKDREFLKHIKDFSSTKGSEESFRILFRHLFNTEIDIYYPQENILKVSDGRWTQDFSIVVETTTGNIDTIVGQYISIKSSNSYITVQVNRIEPLGDYYEIFLNPFRYSQISMGDSVLYSGYSGNVVKTISTFSTYRAGSGYSIGQLFLIPSSELEAQIKIIDVDSIGAITKVQILNFGSGYTDDMYLYLDHNLISQPIIAGIEQDVIGYVEDISFSKPTYAVVEYVSPDYANEIIDNYHYDTFSLFNDYPNDSSVAIIKLNMGATRRYPGYYISDNGFLSNVYYLQDKYYQLYTYVIKCSESIKSYSNIVKALAHPSGTKMFGEQTIRSALSLSYSSADLSSRFVQNNLKLLVESFSFRETKSFAFGKNLEEILTYVESVSKNLSTTKAAVATTISSSIRWVNKRMSVAVTASAPRFIITLLLRGKTALAVASLNKQIFVEKGISDSFSFPTNAPSVDKLINLTSFISSDIEGINIINTSPINVINSLPINPEGFNTSHIYNVETTN